ncbi:hypothetical protein KP79_PYT06493 [Mizuhopecten yessoensis]|uniref:Uncharacterized protein n=2 Tax=Mizuhopecten yessoensis TaxID=6573 RepID=A0A210PUG3_MIZYE|nr:hypothetical protein KP79_PYT06493 [Mizuhopecten yessoensis]
MYDQWEGVLFFGFGSAGNDLLFSNGTARVSYDLVNAKTFVSFEIYQRSASSPVSRTSAVFISHFKTGVKYTISTKNRTCEKGSLSTTNMTTYCASEFHDSGGHPRGRIGGSMAVTNVDILEETIYSTIYQDASNCMPLFAWGLLRAPGLGIAAGADFLDLEEGIRDPSVFTPPSYCPEQMSGKEDDSWFLGLSSLFNKKTALSSQSSSPFF